MSVLCEFCGVVIVGNGYVCCRHPLCDIEYCSETCAERDEE